MRQYEFVKYLSDDWLMLVSKGYATINIDNDSVATMAYYGKE